ncbi:MAG: toxic anion resistance protein [Vulcanimicrobiaceae bacterium]
MTDQPLTLVPPKPVPVVEPTQLEAGGPVKLTPADAAQLDEQLRAFIDEVTTAPIDGDTFKARVEAIVRMGDREVEQSASVSSRLLQRPVNALRLDSGDRGSKVAQGLVELRNTCEKLDPKRQQLLSPRRLLGVVPFGSRIKSYFRGYQSAQDQINGIMTSLMEGKDDLLRDNASIEHERAAMWTLMGSLEKYIYLGKRLDGELSRRIDSIEATDPERAKRIKEQVLFYTRQKVTDLLTQMAVNVQGYMALDLIERNNLELIKGVDRARTTTLSALRTAVIVASALSSQRLALDRVNALKATTGNMIAATSEMLKSQSADIFAQASDPAIDVARLQSAFDNVYATIDLIDAYKIQSLDAMQQTMNALGSQVDKATARLASRTAGETPELPAEAG